MRLSFDGSDDGQHTLADLVKFIEACEQLGMPQGETKLEIGSLGFKTKLRGSGPLTVVTALWDENSPVAGVPVTTPSRLAPATTTTTSAPLVPGLDDPRPTTPLPQAPSAGMPPPTPASPSA